MCGAYTSQVKAVNASTFAHPVSRCLSADAALPLQISLIQCELWVAYCFTTPFMEGTPLYTNLFGIRWPLLRARLRPRLLLLDDASVSSEKKKRELPVAARVFA